VSLLVKEFGVKATEVAMLIQEKLPEETAGIDTVAGSKRELKLSRNKSLELLVLAEEKMDSVLNLMVETKIQVSRSYRETTSTVLLWNRNA